jgi:hypothetical protein
MPFSHVTNSYKRSILTDVFTGYCRQNGIEPTSPEYQDARELILILFQDGHRTVPHLKAALAAAMRRAR